MGGEMGEMGGEMGGEGQRVPEESGGTLPVISEEEGSIFSQTTTTELLKPNRYSSEWGDGSVWVCITYSTYSVYCHAKRCLL